MNIFGVTLKLIVPALVVATLVGLIVSTNVGAVTFYDGVQMARGDGVPETLMGDGGIITTVINVLLFIVGIISVIMLIVGGLRYVISGGNATQVTAAKNTILYAIVGLVIAIFAYAIIGFVIDATTGAGTGFGGGGGGGGSGGGAGAGNNVPATDV